MSRRIKCCYEYGSSCMRLKFSVIVALAMLLSPLGSQAVAATVQSLNLLSDESGQSLSIGLDAPVDYQIFDLEGPSRLVLSFPGAILAADISPVQGEGSVDKI